MFRQLEQSLLEFVRTSNINKYPSNDNDIKNTFPFIIALDTITTAYKNSYNVPFTYDELKIIEEDINTIEEDKYRIEEMNSITYSFIPIDEMSKYNLFEKLIHETMFHNYALTHIVDLVIIANYKPELLTERVVADNYFVDEYNETVEGFIPFILYYVVKGIIPEEYLNKEIPNIEIKAYIITDTNYHKFKHIDYAPIEVNKSIVYTMENIQYDIRSKSIVKTNGEYYLLYECFNTHSNTSEYREANHGWHYEGEDKKIIELIIKYAYIDFRTKEEFESDCLYH